MKVVKHLRGLDVYFKTEKSATLFANYWLTIDPDKADQKNILSEEEYTSDRCEGYNYTMNWYPPADVVEGFLNIFPEEKED